MESIVITGNIGKVEPLRYTDSGQAVLEFSLASNHSRKVGNDWKNDTTWFKCVVWGEKAERMSEGTTVVKGTRVAVTSARINVEAYIGNDGSPRASLKLNVQTVERQGAREDDGQSAPSESRDSAPAQSEQEDMPF